MSQTINWHYYRQHTLLSIKWLLVFLLSSSFLRLFELTLVIKNIFFCLSFSFFFLIFKYSLYLFVTDSSYTSVPLLGLNDPLYIRKCVFPERPSAVCNDIPDGKCGQVDVGGPFMGIPAGDACCCKGDFCNGPFAPQDLRTSRDI